MKQTIRAEETLFTAAHPQLFKHISISQIIISSLIALVGGIAILLSFVWDKTDSTLCMTFLSVGMIFLLISLYRYVNYSHETVYRATGSPIRMGTLYMDTVELQSLQQMLKNNDFSSSFRLSFKEAGNARLDYLKSKDGRFVAIQLFRFVPYTYESISDKLYYMDDDAIDMARCLNI